MATIGLFSQTPYGLQQERQAALSTAADAYGKTNPNDPYGFDRARSSLYMAGSQLGGGIAGLLGAEDPEMKKRSDLDSILKTSELTTPEGWLAVAKKLADLGYGKETQEALAKAQELKAAALEAQVKQSTVFKNMDTATPEMRNAAAVASSVAKPGTPEWNAAYTAKLDELASKEGTVQKAGIAESTREPVYRDKAGQFVYRQDAEGKQVRVPYNGGVDQTTSKTKIDIKGDAQETEFEKKLGEGQAKDVFISKAGAQDAATILQTNQTAKQILNAGAITGTGADFFIGVNNALKQAGIETTSTDAAENSQAYVANMGANVGRLIKQFGAGTGLSNDDRKYATDMAAGRITLTEQSMRKIIDINDRAATNVIKQHNKSVEGIKTNRPLTVEIPTTSLDEKKARLAELERKAKAGGK